MCLRQGPHAGFVYLAADEIGVGQGLGDFGRASPHAEADFEHHGGLATKHRLGVEYQVLVGQAEARAKFCQGACLTFGGALRIT